MSTIALRDDLVNKLREIARRENRPVDDVLAALLLQYQAEAEWEEEILDRALGPALGEDGNIDFDQLRANGSTMRLDELYSEDDQVEQA